MRVAWREHIACDPQMVSGKPRIKDTRIPVAMILGFLASGSSTDEIIEQFPDLTSDDISATLGYACEIISKKRKLPSVAPSQL